jgi:hypothetical protein
MNRGRFEGEKIQKKQGFLCKFTMKIAGLLVLNKKTPPDLEAFSFNAEIARNFTLRRS